METAEERKTTTKKVNRGDASYRIGEVMHSTATAKLSPVKLRIGMVELRFVMSSIGTVTLRGVAFWYRFVLCRVFNT